MIKLEKLSMALGNFRLNDISFTIPTGKYCVLMGKTGCGKTSILEAVCGLSEGIRSGKIILMDKEMTYANAASRGIGYVPQDTALFPSMTVAEHLGFAMAIRKVPDDVQKDRITKLATLLEITHLLERYPKGLSGGESQRVSLGRALSFEPKIICLDEPLSALDEDTHGDMIRLLKTIHKECDATVLHITHSKNEAEQLADILLKIEDGKIIDLSD